MSPPESKPGPETKSNKMKTMKMVLNFSSCNETHIEHSLKKSYEMNKNRMHDGIWNVHVYEIRNNIYVFVCIVQNAMFLKLYMTASLTPPFVLEHFHVFNSFSTCNDTIPETYFVIYVGIGRAGIGSVVFVPILKYK